MSETEHEHDPFQLCGTTIEGKYLISAVVGDGGFGVVYRAEHQGFHEPVAIKCLKLPGRMSSREREMLLSQLREEGRLLLRLSKASSSIVQALDIGAFTKPSGPWVPYLVLEWLEGETLAQFLRKRAERGEGPLSIAETVKLLDPAAQALATAHEQKVAHRDVKPQNLFLAQVGSARTMKVLDFGIAKVLASNPTLTQMMAETNIGPTAFTPRYGAPEQFNKKRGATGPWTDVFALALIVVELASGRMALDGDDPTELYISSADPAMRPTLRSRGIKAPEVVEKVLEKALSVEAKNRYANAGEFWDALKQAVQEAGEEARTVTQSWTPPAELSKEEGMLPTAEFAAGRSLDVSGRDRPGVYVPETIPATVQAEVKEASKVEPTVPANPARLGLEYAKTALPEAAQPAAEAKPAGPEGGGTAAAESLIKPAESAFGVDAQAKSAEPPKADETKTGGAPAAQAEPKKSVRPADPMSETPLHERAPQLGAREESAANTPIEAAAEEPAKAEKAPEKQAKAAAPKAPVQAEPAKPIFGAGEEKKSKGVWIGVGIVALTLAGGALAVISGMDNSVPGAASAKASASAAPRSKPAPGPSASAAPEPSALVDAGGDAAAAPIVPPDDMVYIPPATVKLGTGATEREVALTKGFFIDRNEVTVHAYQACTARRQCSPAKALIISPEQEDAGLEGVSANKEFVDAWGRHCNEPRKALDYPINCVDFANAENYCRFKGRRLPTEAEWELAARGTEGRAHPWGNAEPTCNDACFDRNGQCLDRTVGAGSCPSGSHPKDATPEGIFDMAGNVAEWVADGFSPSPPGGADPLGDPSAGARTVRGGSFFDEKDRLAAVTRFAVLPSTAHVAIGFRCAMDVPAAPPSPPAGASAKTPTKTAAPKKR